MNTLQQDTVEKIVNLMVANDVTLEQVRAGLSAPRFEEEKKSETFIKPEEDKKTKNKK